MKSSIRRTRLSNWRCARAPASSCPALAPFTPAHGGNGVCATFAPANRSPCRRAGKPPSAPASTSSTRSVWPRASVAVAAPSLRTRTPRSSPATGADGPCATTGSPDDARSAPRHRVCLQRTPVRPWEATRAFLRFDLDLRRSRELLHMLHHGRPLVDEIEAKRPHPRQPVVPRLLAHPDDHPVAFELPGQPARCPLQLLRGELAQHPRGDLRPEDEVARLQRVRPPRLAIDTEQLQIVQRARLAIVEPRHPGPALVHRPLAGLTAAVFGRPDREHDLCGGSSAVGHRFRTPRSVKQRRRLHHLRQHTISPRVPRL